MCLVHDKTNEIAEAVDWLRYCRIYMFKLAVAMAVAVKLSKGDFIFLHITVKHYSNITAVASS